MSSNELRSVSWDLKCYINICTPVEQIGAVVLSSFPFPNGFRLSDEWVLNAEWFTWSEISGEKNHLQF